MKNFFLKMQLEMSERLETSTRKKYFKNLDIEEIRQELADMGLNSSMLIELQSTEIAIITPKGILMQIRDEDTTKLGLWGGIIRDDEDSLHCAQRKIFEETGGLMVKLEDLKFVDTNRYQYTYPNGDICYYLADRYYIQLDYVPDILGSVLVNYSFFSHQQDFIEDLLKKI